MKIVGCDLHTRYQQIAMLDDETGELVERRLEHASGEAKEFYRKLTGPVRVGIEATGHTRWFERLLAGLGHELWIGDAARIRAAEVRKQKTDSRDAALLLKLLMSGEFPRLWRPTTEERDLRQLLWHRQKLVWMRNAVGNQLHALAMGEGICRKKQLFTKKGRAELEGLNLDPWASRRRQELLRMLDQVDASLKQFDQAVSEQAAQSAEAVQMMTHPGVGPVTSLAFVLMVGPVDRFQRSKQLASYRDSIPASTPRAGNKSWVRSPNKAIRCCAGCWWRPDIRQRVWTRSYGKIINGSGCVVAAAWRRSQSPGNWQCGCTGCCAAT